MAESRDALRSDDDVDEILKLALRKQGRADADLRSRLSAAAEELGITPAELAEAEAEYAVTKEEQKEFVEFRGRQVREFREHFFAYVVINLLLVGINIFTEGTVGWAVWPILGWGIGLAFHAWGALNTGSESFQEEFAAWRRKRNKRRGASRIHERFGESKTDEDEDDD